MKRSLAPAVAFLASICCASPALSSPAHAGYGYQPSQAHIAACAHAGRPIALPGAFPRQFPFPAGTDIDATRPLRFKHQIGIYGFVSSRGFAATVNFFRYQVPKQGFKLLHFEVDAPNDSEGTYQGHGRVGIWQVRKIFGCPQAMTLAVSTEPSK